MGWDNASTIATEVDRPQRTYPRAMLAGGRGCFGELRFAVRGYVADGSAVIGV